MLLRITRTYWLVLLLAAGCQAPGDSPGSAEAGGNLGHSPPKNLPEIEPGFVGVGWDPSEGRVLLRFEEGQSFVYLVALIAGLGSNDVGLDRGKLAGEQLLTTRRAGDQLELVAPNLDYRVASSEPAIQRAGREAFAESVVASLEILSEDSAGGLIVDATDFALRDAHGVADALANSGQGSFSLAEDRTHPVEGGLAAFADNAYLDVRQTFSGSSPGSEVRSTTPDPEAVTLTIRHHFVRLPEEPMVSRRSDPRAGYFETSWRQLDVAPDEPDTLAVIARHRLPEDGSPITYYLDRGAPEPMRSALLRGARYWEQAFAEAGLPGRFRVELLPEGADPHDARFHVIQWVFRSTRGWSYGASVVDPRSGEILKGHVTLGALRVRQDVRLIEALLAPYGASESDPRVMEAALARLSQLAAHEIGHTLGLRHHFSASTSGRASVMDYPPPRVTLGENGVPELGDAYRDSAGEWDALAIRYGYASFAPEGEESQEKAEARGLDAVVAEMEERGLELHSDRDASAGLHPDAHRWDDGEDPAAALLDSLAVRAAALERFGAGNLKRGRALADLELTLVPLYFWHRFQVDAAAALVGGREFRHELRGGNPPLGIEPLDAVRQRAGLAALLACLTPENLAVPGSVRSLLVPPPPGAGGDRERFEPRAELFDPLHAARAATALTLRPLLDRDRLVRVAVQAGDQPEQLGLPELFGALLDLAWGPAEVSGELDVALRREMRSVLLGELLDLLLDPELPVSVGEPLAESLGLRWTDQGAELSAVPLDRFEQLLVRRRLDSGESESGRRPPARIAPGPPIGCCSADFAP